MSKREVVNELHRNVMKNFKRRKTEVRGLNETLQADLVEMIPYANQNRNIKYILTVIDIFSKYAWAVPVKSKTANDVVNAMKTVLEGRRKRPKNLHTDMGREFFNAPFQNLMRQYGIHHYNTFSTKKAAIVERFNRTLKNKMWKEFSMQGSYKWLALLSKLVAEYNNTKHRTIQMKPIDVNESNEARLLKTVYRNEIRIPHRKTKLRLGAFVRISKYKSVFEKGYTPNWTAEIFKIRKVQNTDPPTYLLEDYEGNEIKGGFYEYELSRAKNPTVYLVEKIIKKRGDQLYVKWLGFGNEHNTWIDKDELL